MLEIAAEFLLAVARETGRRARSWADRGADTGSAHGESGLFTMGERKPRVEELTSVEAAAAGSLLLQTIFRRGIV